MLFVGLHNLELRIDPAARKFQTEFGRRTVVINISDVERRVLINQARILAALYPLEAPQFERTIEILCRRRKNNPLLVGEPGVGLAVSPPGEGDW